MYVGYRYTYKQNNHIHKIKIDKEAGEMDQWFRVLAGLGEDLVPNTLMVIHRHP